MDIHCNCFDYRRNCILIIQRAKAKGYKGEKETGKEVKEVRQTAEEKTCSSKETSGKGGKVIWQIKIQVRRKLICQL